MSNRNYELRRADQEDISFIFNAWLKSYRDGWTVRSVPNTVYYKHHHDVIESILNRPLTTVLVACDVEAADHILGFAVVEYVGEAAVLHYVYTKYAFRGNGIAREMVEMLTDKMQQVVYTHKTRHADIISSKLQSRGFTYNPYWMFRSE